MRVEDLLAKWAHSLSDGAVTVKQPRNVCRLHADRVGYTQRGGHDTDGFRIPCEQTTTEET